MNWPVLIILICAAFADDCSVSIQRKKVLKPKVSFEKGADFVSNSFVEAPESCHQGCCGSTLCDTSLYTGQKVDSAGDNCFYFHCHGDCVFSPSQSAAFSVGVTNRTKVQDIPDFQELLLVTKKPTAASNETALKPVTTPPKTPTVDSKPAPANTSTSQEPPKVDTPEQPAEPQVKEATEKPPPKPVVPKPEPEDNQPEPEPEKTKPKTEPAPQSTQPKPKDKTVIDHDELPVKPKTEPPKKKVTEEHVPTQPEPSLVNEVPAVHHDDKPPKGKGDQEQESGMKTVTVRPPKVKVPVKWDESATKNISVEVDISEIRPTTGYTQRDVVFYVAVIGGSALILFGIGTIIRFYRNKRRRLYSSLTDDYLINGMYSI